MTPSTQKALFLKSPGGPLTIETIGVPKPRPGEILVKVQATSLNPVDWKIQKQAFKLEHYPAVLGLDSAGDVEAVGEGVIAVSVGDRVFFEAVLDRENRRAADQQYVIANAVTVAKIPAKLSYEDAATFPCAGGAAYIGLFSPQGLAIPNPLAERTQEVGDTIVIIGGASSVGQYAIQFAKLAGFSNIIATCSVHHAHHLKSLGATHIINRHVPFHTLSAEISEITGGQPITDVFDTISTQETQQMAYNLISPSDGKLALVMPEAIKDRLPGKTVDVKRVTLMSDKPENSEIRLLLYRKMNILLNEGLIKPIRHEVLPNGLAGIPGGLERLEKGLVSGIKLVACPSDTP